MQRPNHKYTYDPFTLDFALTLVVGARIEPNVDRSPQYGLEEVRGRSLVLGGLYHYIM